MVYALALFGIGILMIIFFSEKLVEATVGTSLGFGVSTFLISVIFIGFDPENLGLGAIASYDAATGIALGTVIGSAMVAIALALGITALIVPLKFEAVPIQIPLLQAGAVVLFGMLSIDGMLSRFDGMILLLSYGLTLWYLISMAKRGLVIKPHGEAAEVIEKDLTMDRWKAVAWFIASLAGIAIGSEMVVLSSHQIIAEFGFSETVFGMSILALAISVEEVGRELPAALKGRSEITMGNVVGSVLAFFLFNTGVIALIRPIPVTAEVIHFYLPLSLAVVLFVTFLMVRKAIPRWVGGLLAISYIIFFVWGYVG